MSWAVREMVCLAAPGEGVMLRVKFNGGLWSRGTLIERVKDSLNSEWKVEFDDGTSREDIVFGNNDMFTVFEESAYGDEVQILCPDEVWHNGTLVTLINGDGLFGVEFEDGDWVEDIKIHSKYLRFRDQVKEAKRLRQMQDTYKERAEKRKLCEQANTEPDRQEESHITVATRPVRQTSSTLHADRYKTENDRKRTHNGKTGENNRKRTRSGKTKAPKYDIGHVCGSKVLQGCHFLKIHWEGCETDVDSWEPFYRLVKDVGAKHVHDLMMQYERNT